MTKYKTYYMHTIDSKPAVFDKRDKYIYIAFNVAVFAASLATIRAQQSKAVLAYSTLERRLGYQRVKVPV